MRVYVCVCVCVCVKRGREREGERERQDGNGSHGDQVVLMSKMADMNTSDHMWSREVTALGLSETVVAALLAPRVPLKHTQWQTARLNTLNALDE